ncbi:MAG: spermidine synthase, partial [Gammaproteobacteria bacterium]
MKALTRTDSGYLLFNLSSHLIALAVMLPATFLAGMTLPLFTTILLDRGYGEKSVGQVYAFNTLGAIAGTFIALFVLLPHWGIEDGMLIGGGLDVAVGIGFIALTTAGRDAGVLMRFRVAIASLLYIVLLSILFSPDPRQMASGVFRDARARMPDVNHVLAHYDGSTASVSVLHHTKDGVTSILTNGKPDAAASTVENGRQTGDEDTMVLLAALPLSINPSAGKIAVIGFGSGITTHTLLASPAVRRVDTIEIERFMYEGARFFGGRSERAFNDPRSRVVFEDAKTYFHLNSQKYDIIISEPSNPWVSGISSLYSEEFYRMISRFLEPDGIFVQWIHVYESNTELLYSMLKALASNFHDFHVYGTSDADVLIMASPCCELPLPGKGLFDLLSMKRDLDRIKVRSEADLLLRFFADKGMLEPGMAESPVPVNSDYFPYVDLHAAKARFLDQPMPGLNQLREYPVPVLVHFRPAVFRWSGPPTPTETRLGSRLAVDAETLSSEGGVPDWQSEPVTAVRPYIDLLRAYRQSCDAGIDDFSWEHAYLNVMMA